MLSTALVSLLLATTPPKANADSEHCSQPKAAEAPAAAGAKTAGAEVIQRGEKLTGTAQKVTLDALLASPEQHAGKTVALEGTARKVCTKKGCWMELAAANDAKANGVRVTFKDYGFFVPLDSAGSQVKLEGVVKVAELTDANAKHLEAEGANVPRGKDGKPREVQLVANGVELRR